MSAGEKAERNQVRKRLKESAPNAKPNKTVVTGMHNELRAQILILLNERVASRPEICKELGASFDHVRYEMEVLKKTKPPLIELVHEKPVRGTVEKFYRATTRAYLDDAEWPNVPDAVKAGMRGSLLGTLVDDAVAAVQGGTFDSLENAHMSWTPMILDERGWEGLTTILLRALEEAIEIKEESAERLSANDAKGTSCTVSILGYPSANEERKVGPPSDGEDVEDSAQREGQRPRKQAATKKSKIRKAKAPKGKAAGKGKARGKGAKRKK